MQGIVFTHFCDMLESKGGIPLLQRTLDRASIEDDAFVATGNYADGDMLVLLEVACGELHTTPQELLREFGQFLFASFARHYEAMILQFDTLKELLLHIDSVIHVEVSKLYPESSLPMFDYEDHHDNQLLMIYQSPRKMCHLAEGLIEGAAIYYNQPIEMRQRRCMHEGAPCCDIEVNFIER